ncbi:MAG: N-acetylglucosamine-6-phosphate deacetylase [Actinobacteria bacterium]|nr:N-acetylglucosamine-6-phosphate deacetylase [Actinomycetota bacterium]
MSDPVPGARRLGVREALVDGEWVSGDVEIGAAGTVAAVGVGGGRSDPVGTDVAIPGLVDLQVNGFAGVDLRDADAEGYRVAAESLAAHGATAVQPTFFGLSVDGYRDALGALAEIRTEQQQALERGALRGCRFLRAHLEGPFLNARFKGAHDERTFLDPSVAVADTLLRTGEVGFVTLAPELPGGLDLVRHLVERGVVVSIGHSDASDTCTMAAVDAGARHLTHCWNAHRRLTSRDPGPAAVALARTHLVVGLIADGIHVADEVVRLTLAAARGRVAATTDAIAAAGLDDPDRWTEEADLPVTVRDGWATLSDGTLAGSVATPVEVLRQLLRVGLDLASAVDACGGVQRRLLGLDDVRARPGDVADLVVLDDTMSVRRTLVAGHEVHRS